MKIPVNWRRLFLAGLLASLAIDALTHAAWVLFQRKMEAALRTPYTNPDFSGGLILGFVGIGLYAAIRPRCGPEPKTAVLAGLLCYLALVVIPTLIDAHRNGLVLPIWLLAISHATGFAMIVVATVTGAWAYEWRWE